MANRSFNNVTQRFNFVEWTPAVSRAANRADSPAELGVPGPLGKALRTQNIILPRVGLSENNRKELPRKRIVNPSVQKYIDNL